MHTAAIRLNHWFGGATNRLVSFGGTMAVFSFLPGQEKALAFTHTMVLEIARTLFVLFFAVILHECAHGWVAYKCGDSTAKDAGRLTLNPLKHIDPLGTFIVPFVLRSLGVMPLGWAKPVPVNFANLRNPRRDMILVSLAGPLANLLLALAFRELAILTANLVLQEIWVTAVVLNILVAVFNLLPVPPLDGSRVLAGLLPVPLAHRFARLEPFGIVILIVLLNVGLLNWLDGVVSLLVRVLGMGQLMGKY